MNLQKRNNNKAIWFVVLGVSSLVVMTIFSVGILGSVMYATDTPPRIQVVVYAIDISLLIITYCIGYGLGIIFRRSKDDTISDMGTFELSNFIAQCQTHLDYIKKEEQEEQIRVKEFKR